MAEIPLTGIADNFIVPGQYAEILFAQGPASVALGAREVCLVMPMTAAGTWTAGELYGPLKSTGEASDGAGIGSPAHRAAKIFITANPGAKLFILPYAETVGGRPAKAPATVTWVTDPTDSGAPTITLCGEAIKTVFSSSDTITTIAEAQVLAINAREHLPVTAANVAGVLTVTAKINGISQGDGTTGVLRIRASIDSGIGPSVTASGAALGLGTGAAFSVMFQGSNAAPALPALKAQRPRRLSSLSLSQTSPRSGSTTSGRACGTRRRFSPWRYMSALRACPLAGCAVLPLPLTPARLLPPKHWRPLATMNGCRSFGSRTVSTTRPN